MILAPNNGAVGIQPVGTKARCINRQGSALAIGDVVVTSFGHSEYVYPPLDTVASLEGSPFSSVVKADGNDAALRTGFVGVVTSLLSNAGADDTYVEVQFGGICQAKVKGASATAVAAGNALAIGNDAGVFAIGDATDSTVCAAVALGTVTAATTSTIWVVLNGQLQTGVVV
jgi:hypothetical protein